jgi:hypothetical protein
MCIKRILNKENALPKSAKSHFACLCHLGINSTPKHNSGSIFHYIIYATIGKECNMDPSTMSFIILWINNQGSCFNWLVWLRTQYAFTYTALWTWSPNRRTWKTLFLSCTNTSCKDDIVLNRWERLFKATEWPVTTVTVTHIKWNDRNENKSIYTTLSPTQTTQVATKGMKYSLCTKK